MLGIAAYSIIVELSRLVKRYFSKNEIIALFYFVF